MDQPKITQLAKIMEMNQEAIRLLSLYLSESPDFINQELIESMCSECNIDLKDAFVNLLSAILGLEPENNPRDRELVTTYLFPAIRQVDPQYYQTNPYYQHIHIPEVHSGNWNLKYEKYKPYETFVCDELQVDENLKEIPQIGFFTTEFSFPAVLQAGNEWMAIKPNEIETMRQAIDTVTGQVITFGLGLGYYAYMVSEKPTVRSITIVEKDSEIISLFQNYILPQFPNKHKVVLIHADAFEYITHLMPALKYDYAFVDLWHDVSDGYPLYIKMKKLERLHPHTVFLYWIETSLLSHMRRRLFYQLQHTCSLEAEGLSRISFPFTYDQLIHYLSNPFLKRLLR